MKVCKVLIFSLILAKNFNFKGDKGVKADCHHS